MYDYVVRTVFRSAFDAPGAKVTLPPPVRASFAQMGLRGPVGASAVTYGAVTSREGKTKGSVP